VLLLKLVAVCVLVLCVSAQLPTFPNIGYLGSGYDYYYGCPLTTESSESPDPGYRQFVFDLDDYGNETTPDQKYRIPKGTDVELCNECSVVWHTSNVTSSQTYQHILNDSVSGSFNFIVAQFSGSYDYQHVNYWTNYSSDVFTSTTTDCCVYTASVQTFNAPRFSKDFLEGVKYMPTSYSPSTSSFFIEFIQAFGTHYTGTVTMGGRFGQRSRFTAESWKILQSTGLSISVSAGFSAQSISAAVKVMTNDQKSYAASFSNLTTSQSVFSVGGELPSSFKVSDWLPSSKKDPMPLGAKIHLLSDLFNDMYFPNDPEISAKGSAVLAALKDYCQYLVKSGAIKSCDAPGSEFYQPKVLV